mmetsp:Transcript_57977/g.115091  ORF Transcript_57977/g.115091 Transcript_57977/m.115091 type:complete len:358 (-) Transcript_57977:196-1269(-)
MPDQGFRPQSFTLRSLLSLTLILTLTPRSAHGVNVSMMTVQNEPLAPSPWEACFYDAQEESAFIADHLGPQLAAGALEGRHPPVTLLGFDDQKDNIEAWSELLLADGQPAAPFIGGIAYHWYAGDHFEALARAVRRAPGKVFLGTEATYELTRLADGAASEKWVEHGVWSRGEGYAHAIVGDLNAGSSGWIDWNVLLDSTGGPNHLGNVCDAPIIADAALDRLHLHPQFFFLGHFSKFIPPRSQRIGLNAHANDKQQPAKLPESHYWPYNISSSEVAYGRCPTGPPQAVAFRRPEGRYVLVVLNCQDEPAVIHVQGAGDSVDGGSSPGSSVHQSTIPPHAIRTFILEAKDEAEDRRG